MRDLIDRRFNVNEDVVVALGNARVPGDMKKCNGKQYKVSAVRYVSISQATCGSHGFPYYELKGCNSVKGIPFSWIGEWLVPAGGEI